MPASRAPSPSLTLAVTMCALVNLVPVLLALANVLPSYDAEVHMFFGDHYARAWFDPWQGRWYGGFWVYSYPPLAHQLTAALASLMGMETAHAGVTLAAALTLTVGVWRLADEVAGRDAAGWAALLASVLPAGWATLYMWGQLPNALSLGLALLAASYLIVYVRRGDPWALAAWAGLGGASTAAHHLTGMIAMPMLAAAAIAHTLAVSDPTPRRTRAARAAAALMCGALAAAATVIPFVWWMHNGRVAQAPVSHASRSNFFYDADRMFEFCLGLWSLPLIALAMGLRQAVRERPLLPFVLLAALWGVISLGPAITPLPRLLFGGFASWLTYERFALWATALLLVPFGAALAEIGSRRVAAMLFAAFLAGATVMAGLARLRGEDAPDPAPASLRQAAGWLEQDGRDGWRYLTLGVGLNRSIRLSRLTRAASVDGAYLTARRDPLLSRSGANIVDGAALGGADDLGFVRFLLRFPAERQLRWVVSGNTVADSTLRALGWTQRETWGGATADATDHLSVWEAPAAGISASGLPPTARIGASRPSPRPASPAPLRWMWALAPLGLLAFGLLAARRVDRATS